VGRGIFRGWRRPGEPNPSSVGGRSRGAIGIFGPNRRHRSPEVVVEFGIPTRYLGVEDRGVGHRKEASGLSDIQTVLDRVAPERAAVLGHCVFRVETPNLRLLGCAK